MNPSPSAYVRFGAQGVGVPNPLEDHLCAVGLIASEFAIAFGNADWGNVAGLRLDLGTFKVDFQEYIRARSGDERDEAEEGGPGKLDHTAAGAIHAQERMGVSGGICADLIEGHHSGLQSTGLARQLSNSLFENCACWEGGSFPLSAWRSPAQSLNFHCHEVSRTIPAVAPWSLHVGSEVFRYPLPEFYGGGTKNSSAECGTPNVVYSSGVRQKHLFAPEHQAREGCADLSVCARRPRP